MCLLALRRRHVSRRLDAFSPLTHSNPVSNLRRVGGVRLGSFCRVHHGGGNRRGGGARVTQDNDRRSTSANFMETPANRAALLRWHGVQSWPALCGRGRADRPLGTRTTPTRSYGRDRGYLESGGIRPHWEPRRQGHRHPAHPAGAVAIPLRAPGRRQPPASHLANLQPDGQRRRCGRRHRLPDSRRRLGLRDRHTATGAEVPAMDPREATFRATSHWKETREKEKDPRV